MEIRQVVVRLAPHDGSMRRTGHPKAGATVAKPRGAPSAIVTQLEQESRSAVSRFWTLEDVNAIVIRVFGTNSPRNPPNRPDNLAANDQFECIDTVFPNPPSVALP
jgi:hypothetical protein